MNSCDIKIEDVGGYYKMSCEKCGSTAFSNGLNESRGLFHNPRCPSIGDSVIKTNKIICVDYDGTLTEFPELLDSFIRRALDLGYKVIIATMRFVHEEDGGLKYLAEEYNIPIYYTGRKAKMEFLQAFNIIPDLWIDDNPHWIFHDSK